MATLLAISDTAAMRTGGGRGKQENKRVGEQKAREGKENKDRRRKKESRKEDGG